MSCCLAFLVVGHGFVELDVTLPLLLARDVHSLLIGPGSNVDVADVGVELQQQYIGDCSVNLWFLIVTS